jgi:hypothetical protein
MGLSHICTLLSARENPEAIQAMTEELRCGWIWLPMSGASLEVLKAVELDEMLSKFAASVADSTTPRIYLHCSAGIHRTGFFASVILRLSSEPDVKGALGALRPVTADQIGEDRFALAISRADRFLEESR